MRFPSRPLAVVVIAMAGGGEATAQGGPTHSHRPSTAPSLGLRLDTLATDLRAPWSLAFLPGGEILIAEKHGGIRRLVDGALDPTPVPGGPATVFQQSDAGIFDLVLDPDFGMNRLVYLTFAEGTNDANHTALFRARYHDGRLHGGRVIWRAWPVKRGTGHFGSRIAFLPDRTLLLSVGDGYAYRDQAQDLGSGLGKIVRLTREGAPPADNPFVDSAAALREIWSYGHRNPQGLLVDPRDGTVWSHEHGPKGGDEINRIERGANYGWPRTTHGIDYDGKPISPDRELPGIVSPSVVWIPSIAPSGFALYLGDRFPAWRGDFLVGALAGKHLRRVRLRPGQPAEEEVLLAELATRIRDVRVGPDGYVYLLTDEKAGRLLRLRPEDGGRVKGKGSR